MKTTIEINGYVLLIEETEGVLTVKAQKDEETVEEFEIDTTEEGDGEGVKAFGEEDFEDETDESEETDEADDEDFEEEDFEEEAEEETKLESFNSFIKKRK